MKLTMASTDLHNKKVLKTLEQSYQTKEEVTRLEFELVDVDEQQCSYDMNRFIIFYGDIVAWLKIDHPSHISK